MSQGRTQHRAASRSIRQNGAEPDVRRIDRFFQWSLLGMLGAGFLAVASSGELDWLTIGLVSIALGLRVALILEFLTAAGRADIDRWVTWLSFAYVAFYPIDFWYLSQAFLSATVHMICFVASVKIVTATSERDYAFVKMIAMLELLAAALLSAGPAFFVCLGVFLLFTIAALASGEVRRSADRFAENQTARPHAVAPAKGFGRRLGLLSSGLFAGVLIMTAGMFFVLPRTARAALQHFVPQRYITGFDNQVTLGELG
ncbi:MAG: transglutaminaseTgpA domain-containing protein, partial [Acidobacteriota bacterium]